jgi:hypothetical protein
MRSCCVYGQRNARFEERSAATIVASDRCRHPGSRLFAGNGQNPRWYAAEGRADRRCRC